MAVNNELILLSNRELLAANSASTNAYIATMKEMSDAHIASLKEMFVTQSSALLTMSNNFITNNTAFVNASDQATASQTLRDSEKLSSSEIALIASKHAGVSCSMGYCYCKHVYNICIS